MGPGASVVVVGASVVVVGASVVVVGASVVVVGGRVVVVVGGRVVVVVGGRVVVGLSVVGGAVVGAAVVAGMGLAGGAGAGGELGVGAAGVVFVGKRRVSFEKKFLSFAFDSGLVVVVCLMDVVGRFVDSGVAAMVVSASTEVGTSRSLSEAGRSVVAWRVVGGDVSVARSATSGGAET
ncbi:MAG: hypothetical protein IT195_11295 [Microthrixaceae bacterium]|nr:hypothetical protein [Microthrixaceae bacterium]